MKETRDFTNIMYDELTISVESVAVSQTHQDSTVDVELNNVTGQSIADMLLQLDTEDIESLAAFLLEYLKEAG